MIRRPPRSTRTDTLFPYTTLFRSGLVDLHVHLTVDPGDDYRAAAVDPDEWGVVVGAKNAGITLRAGFTTVREAGSAQRSEEHTSELQSLMRISYAVFCLKKKTTNNIHNKYPNDPHTLKQYQS